LEIYFILIWQIHYLRKTKYAGKIFLQAKPHPKQSQVAALPNTENFLSTTNVGSKRLFYTEWKDFYADEIGQLAFSPISSHPIETKNEIVG